LISYITLGCRDLKLAESFYSPIMNKMGGTPAYRTDRLLAWSLGGNGPLLVVNLPFDGEVATYGNGGMVAFKVESQESVMALHSLAIELGGVDEGAPGPRGKSFYGAYVRDLDGNKLNFHC
jgi:catechol 2,3-dioxygenase-like lactoylglutathione lyase family enzyme